MKPEDVKEVLRRIDEFNEIKVGDTIANASETRKICHCNRDYPTGHKEISYLKSQSPTELLTSMERDEYVLNNWIKVPKEITKA